jgi:hypothetical protein
MFVRKSQSQIRQQTGTGHFVGLPALGDSLLGFALLKRLSFRGFRVFRGQRDTRQITP